MQVAVKTGEGLNRVLTITIPKEQVEQNIDSEVKEYAKKAKIDGFRPGKVPLSYIRKRFGEAIREHEVMKLMEQNIDVALQQEKLDVAAITNVEKITDKPGQDLQYKAELEVYPDVKFKDLSGETITEFNVDITDADVNDMMLRLRKQRADWHEVDRAAKKDDQVMIDFEGKINGESFQGNTGKNVPLVLGSKTMLPGFEEGILKHKAGDKFDINIDFPKDYPSAEVAGKKAVFAITLHKVNEQSLPELNAEFAKSLGYEEGVDALTKAMREDMQKTIDRALRDKTKSEVKEVLLKINAIDVPKGLLERAKENQLQYAAKQHGQNNFSDDYIQKLTADTQENMAYDILIRHYIKQNKVKLDDKRFSQKMAEVIASSPFGAEMLQYIAKDPRRRAEIENMALEEQVIDLLLAEAKRKTKKMSYNEALGLDKE